MARKPVVLITVEGGVASIEAASEIVRVTIHDFDSIGAGGPITCVWCGADVQPNELIGGSDHTCPHCQNPTIPKFFNDLPMFHTFLCTNGGKWKKVSIDTAECQENDSAYIVGDVVKFELNEEVFPY